MDHPPLLGADVCRFGWIGCAGPTQKQNREISAAAFSKQRLELRIGTIRLGNHDVGLAVANCVDRGARRFNRSQLALILRQGPGNPRRNRIVSRDYENSTHLSPGLSEKATA